MSSERWQLLSCAVVVLAIVAVPYTAASLAVDVGCSRHLCQLQRKLFRCFWCLMAPCGAVKTLPVLMVPCDALRCRESFSANTQSSLPTRHWIGRLVRLNKHD